MVASVAARLRSGIVPGIVVALAALPTPARADRAPIDAAPASGEFAELFEPSGVARLVDGDLLIVEDEPGRALQRFALTLEGGRPRLVAGATLEPTGSLFARLEIGPLDDLEGAARDAAGRIYVVGSHDDVGERRRSDRQKLLRFAVTGGRMEGIAMTRRLGVDLARAYPTLSAALDEDAGELDIEALAVDRRRGQLLIGLRSPRIGGDAVIVRLSEPEAYLDGEGPPAFAAAPWTLDLDRGGLRAMSYDDRTDQLLLVSRRESGGRFKLWRVAADGATPPRRIRLPRELVSLDDVEGLTVLDDGPAAARGVLFVRDDGDRGKRRGASWFIVSRERLGIATAARR